MQRKLNDQDKKDSMQFVEIPDFLTDWRVKSKIWDKLKDFSIEEFYGQTSCCVHKTFGQCALWDFYFYQEYSICLMYSSILLDARDQAEKYS